MNIKKKYFGMTLSQIGILAVMAIFGCIVIGILGSMISSGATDLQLAQQVNTLTPSPVPTATSTSWVAVTPIPNWQQFSFASGKAQIWLPNSYMGGDTLTSAEEIMVTVRATIDDEVFADIIQNSILSPDVTFLALDTNLTNVVIKFIYIRSQPINPDLQLTMDDYLNQLMNEYSGGTERMVERKITQLDNFSAGKLVLDSKVLVEDIDALVSIAIYMVRVENTMWFITFRTGREEYLSYQPTIEAILNSFWIESSE